MAAPQIPVTMLSGFLGAGKTTLLRYLLENTSLKVGCIVNDVAGVNIDAKLIRNDRNRDRSGGINTTSDLADTIELANGCACCSIQDELFASFEQLLALADSKGATYDRFVLENSGVAEPQNIREKFAEAIAAGHPLMARISLDTMVTIVDSSSFIKDYASRVALAARPDLGEGGNLRPVVDLLVEQIECADFVLLNKTDMLAERQLDSLAAIVASLNPLAKVLACEQARVDIPTVFGPQARGLVAHLNIEGQHRGAVAAARAAAADDQADEDCEQCAAEGVDHAAEHARVGTTNGHGHGRGAADGHKHGHGHGHDHDHGHGHAHDGAGGDAHEGHGGKKHKHAHAHAHDEHAHAHDEHAGHSHAGHSHAEHGHAKARQETTAAARFGIRSFVYSRRRPFHPQRLREMVLRWLPVTTNRALEGDAAAAGASPIKAVLRSKGFLWMSHSHATAFYWSHAGQHFEIRDEGDWWAAVPESDWPAAEAQRAVILGDFDAATEFGDRRQEIVFIGAGMDEAAISKQLDAALLTDEELRKYVANWASCPDPPHALPAAGGAGA